MKKLLTAVTVAMLAFAGSAYAESIVQCVELPDPPTAFDLVQTTWTDTATFNQFDPSLGVLTHVKIALWGEFAGSVDYENTDTGYAHMVDFDLDGSITATVEGGTPVLNLNLPVISFSQMVAAGGSGTETGSGSGWTSAHNDPNLAFYTGVGTFDVDVLAEGIFSGAASSNVIFDADGSARAKVCVIYCYEDQPIPEPATMTLLGTGLAGLICLRRRFMA